MNPQIKTLKWQAYVARRVLGGWHSWRGQGRSYRLHLPFGCILYNKTVTSCTAQSESSVSSSVPENSETRRGIRQSPEFVVKAVGQNCKQPAELGSNGASLTWQAPYPAGSVWVMGSYQCLPSSSLTGESGDRGGREMVLWMAEKLASQMRNCSPVFG